MLKQRHKITVSYDGTAYAGWQVQPNALAVQEVIETALSNLSEARVRVHGSGRTDQGVHAAGQVAHFDATLKVPVGKLPLVLNNMLPADIRIVSARKVSQDFHARRSAVSKEYRYFIWNRPLMDPFKRLYRAHIRQPLDLKAMRKAAALFTGMHDFSAFSSASTKIQETYVREIFSIVIREDDGDICIKVKGGGFLYKMVRSIAGYLIRVGLGEVPPESVAQIIKSRKRTAQVPTASPSGLFLWQVRY